MVTSNQITTRRVCFEDVAARSVFAPWLIGHGFGYVGLTDLIRETSNLTLRVGIESTSPNTLAYHTNRSTLM